jgi:hypothetical protein
VADRVFFVSSSPEEFIRGVSLPEEMLSDLLAISRLSAEDIEQVATALNAASGFLDDAGLTAVVRQTVMDEGAADAVKRAIRSLRPESVDQTLTTLRTWRRADATRIDRFPDDSLQSIETILPRLIRSFPSLERQRKARRLEALTGNQVRETEIVCDARPVFDSERSAVEGFVTQRESPFVSAEAEADSQSVLRALTATGAEREEYRKAIINAEILDFGPSETHELMPALRRFIETHRDSNDPADLVAVGSAIRKFIAIAPGSEAIDFAADLLRAGSRFPLPIEIEVEISKMVVRRLTANPPARTDRCSELASRLVELAETYLNPRLLGRQKHGAVALNAVLGVFLTRDPRVSSILQRVQSLGVNWFQQLLARQAAVLVSELRRRSDNEGQNELLASLQELIAAAAPVSSK